MKTFGYQEYVTKGLVVSSIIVVIAIALIVLGLVGFTRLYRLVNQGRMTKFKMLPLELVCIIAAILGGTFLIGNGMVFMHGIYLVNETEADAVEIVGIIEDIDLIFLPQQYLFPSETNPLTAEVEIDGINYYFLSTSNLSEGEIIRFRYLPKSKAVLSYQPASFSEWSLSEWSQPTTQERVNPFHILFSFVFTGAIIIAILDSKNGYLDRKLEQKIYLEDEHWDKDEVRFHSSYRDHAIAFCVIVLVAGVLLTSFLRSLMVLIPVSIVILGVLAIVFGKYRNWKLTYNERELILFLGTGKKEIIPLENVISVQKKLENRYLSKGLVYSVVVIKYQSVILTKTMIQTIKLDFRCQVGIRRFLKFMSADDDFV